MITRQRLIPATLLVIGVLTLLLFPTTQLAVSSNSHDSTASIALEEHWIKGAAPILAANFDSVEITNVNKDVEASFVFDVALGQIYGIKADYTLAPIDVRALGLSSELAKFEKERSEVFCNNKDQKYCELILAWPENANPDAHFIGLRLEDSLYGIVEIGLAQKLGVKID